MKMKTDLDYSKQEVENIYELERTDQTEYFTYKNPHDIFKTLCSIQLALLIISIIWGLIRKIYWWQDLYFNLSLLICVPIAAALCACNFLFYAFRNKLSFMHLDWIVNSLYIPIFGSLSWFQCFIVSILSGLCEEAFFRGILSVETGIYISSLIFGTLHLGDKKLLPSAVWITLIGFLLAVLYKTTNNLLICMLIHFLNNSASFLWIMTIIKKQKLPNNTKQAG